MSKSPAFQAEEKKAHTVSSKELDFPETIFIRDIESRVIQAFVVQCLFKIEGVSLLGGNFIDNILGRDSVEGVRGIHVEQDSRNHSVSVRVEINITYGVPIPEKAKEIQENIAEEITTLTGLHVSCVHVIFKNVTIPDHTKKQIANVKNDNTPQEIEEMEDEFSDRF